MKISWKTIGTLAIGMAFLFAIQQVPFQKILNAQAQTTRMIGGPTDDPFKTSYLTPTSSSPRNPMPAYALPMVPMYIYTGSYQPMAPLQLDINADGLLDFVYSLVYDYSSGKYTHQYVILNTGNGYNLVYVCKYQLESGVTTYKGDCAAQ